MADFINEGKSIPHTASGAVTAGDVLLVGEKIAVAKHGIADTDAAGLFECGHFAQLFAAKPLGQCSQGNNARLAGGLRP